MFDDIIFTPLALPELEFDRERLLAWYDERKQRGYEEYVAKINYPWNVVWLRDEDRGVEWHEDLHSLFPNWTYCLDRLPHSIFRKVYILEQVIDVAPHRDVSREEFVGLGPSTYRCMLINDHPETLYYLRGPNPPEGSLEEEKLFPRFPRERMWFAHNNHNARHGAILPPEGKRKLLLCIWGNVFSKSHFALLEKSQAEYAEWMIK